MGLNFEFLNKYWSDLAKIMEFAENYAYTDPTSCLAKIGLFAEKVINEVYISEEFDKNEKTNQYERVKFLYSQGIINDNLYKWFSQIRIKRNESVHEDNSSTEKALVCINFAFNIAVWFMKVYGDSSFIPQEYKEPQKPEKPIDYTRLVLNQEKKLKEQEDIIEKLQKEREQKNLVTPQQQKTTEERIKASAEITNKIKLSEAQTRVLIDEELRAVGWEVDTPNLRYSKGTRPEKGRNIAIAEWPTLPLRGKNDTCYVDYALFCGLKMVGMIEAKAYLKNVYDVIDNQGHDYSQKVRDEDKDYIINSWGNYKVPFVFATNGRPYLEQIKTESGIWFHDLRKSTNIPEAMRGWFSPEDLIAKLEQDIEESEQKLENMPYDFLRDSEGLNLRYYQLEAIEAVEKAVLSNQKRILLAMATGTGKTRTILGLIYRFLKANRFRRILFLVDRNALGEQAQDVFNDVRLEDLLPLNKICNINKLGEYDLSKETRVQVATVQGMVAQIMGLNENKKIPSTGSFDCIIIDEAHRGYTLDKELSENELIYRNQEDFISKYKYVIEYFDAFKIGLTATPAIHTTSIFGRPVYNYTYRNAVIDGYLVDYDAPYIIKTKLNQEGIHHKATEMLARYNPVTHELLNPEELKDDMDFDVEDFNRKVITPEFTKTALKQVAKYIDPTSEEKTLIFAATDLHADSIVDELRNIYKEQDIPSDAIQKITGKLGDQTKIRNKIKEFKNEHYPTIAVTVDLLTTGIDVPEITKLVFMRRIKSRILYEQMIGRGTRLCPKINKTHFDIIDCVDIYNYLSDVTTMKPVAANKSITISELFDGYGKIEDEENKEEIENEITAKIIVKLQREKNTVTEEINNVFESETGLGVKKFIEEVNRLYRTDKTECKNFLIKHRYSIQYLKAKKDFKGYTIPISNRIDRLMVADRGYGNNQKPKDYLESFKKFVQSNRNKIAALEICCTNPAELTLETLKSLKTELDKNGYNELNLNSAISQVKKEEIVADIISIVRSYAMNVELIPHEQRINNAIKKLKQNHNFSAMENKWIERIKNYLINESVINEQVFDQNINFNKAGGFKMINKVFNNNLKFIIREINTYLYEDKAA